MSNETLTAQDRCDRCGAQAYVKVTLTTTGSVLLFCAHHAREHNDKLKSIAVEIKSFVDELLPK
jgi:hypothetical protein